MRIKITLALLSAFLFAACDIGPTAIPALVPAEKAAYQQKGTGAISGVAYLRDDQGNVQPGDKCRIFLFPQTPYFVDWVKAKINKSAPPLDPAAKTYVRSTVADDKGGFNFSHLPDGSYILYTDLTVWTMGNMGPYTNEMELVNPTKVPVTKTVQITGGLTVKMKLY